MPTMKEPSPPLTDNPAGHTLYPVSTTSRTPPGTVVRAARPSKKSAPQERPLRSLPKRDPRKPLLSYVEFRGGPEAWIQVRTRGTSVRVPGCTSVAELVLLLNNQGYR